MPSLNQRLLWELEEIRDELSAIMDKFSREEFAWAPRPDMKSPQALLREIGIMEKLCVALASGGELLDWETAIEWQGDDVGTHMQDLKEVREDTIQFLESTSPETLVVPVAVPSQWQQYFREAEVEPEELIRWVARHEYYHLGQLVTYSWLLGNNPYKEGQR